MASGWHGFASPDEMRVDRYHAGMKKALAASAIACMASGLVGQGSQFGSQQVITTAADGAESVYAADLDGDGDMDVLSASLVDDKIAWYANDGRGERHEWLSGTRPLQVHCDG
jgi:hypothetical protein